MRAGRPYRPWRHGLNDGIKAPCFAIVDMIIVHYEKVPFLLRKSFVHRPQSGFFVAYYLKLPIFLVGILFVGNSSRLTSEAF